MSHDTASGPRGQGVVTTEVFLQPDFPASDRRPDSWSEARGCGRLLFHRSHSRIGRTRSGVHRNRNAGSLAPPFTRTHTAHGRHCSRVINPVSMAAARLAKDFSVLRSALGCSVLRGPWGHGRGAWRPGGCRRGGTRARRVPLRVPRDSARHSQAGRCASEGAALPPTSTIGGLRRHPGIPLSCSIRRH